MNAGVHVATVGTHNRELHVIAWPNGIGLTPSLNTHAGDTMRHDQARALGEALIAASDPTAAHHAAIATPEDIDPEDARELLNPKPPAPVIAPKWTQTPRERA